MSSMRLNPTPPWQVYDASMASRVWILMISAFKPTVSSLVSCKVFLTEV